LNLFSPLNMLRPSKIATVFKARFLKIDRLYTRSGEDVYASTPLMRVTGADGRVYTVPDGWGVAAIDVLIDKVFYRGGIPDRRVPVTDGDLPEFLWPQTAAAGAGLAHETDIRQVIDRVAGALAASAVHGGLLRDPQDAAAFHDELRHILIHRRAMIEIAALASVGVEWAYGIKMPWRPRENISSFAAPEKDATAIVVGRDTATPDILKRLMAMTALLRLDNDGARVRVTLPVEHADAPGFIAHAARVEALAQTEPFGRRLLCVAANRVIDACDRDSLAGFDPAFNLTLRQAVIDARRTGLDDAVIAQAIARARQGDESFTLPDAPDDDGLSLDAVLSVPDSFIENALTGHGLTQVQDGIAVPQADAGEVLAALADAAWQTGMPRILFRDRVAVEDAGISAGGGLVAAGGVFAPSAMIDLFSFVSADNDSIDVAGIRHTVSVMTLALEAALSLSDTGAKTQSLRPVVIGTAGMSSVLMAAGLSYDSDDGRAYAAALTALVSGAALQASALMADAIGAFDSYAPMSRVFLKSVKQKMARLNGAVLAGGVNPRRCPDAALLQAAITAWDRAYATGKEQGFRHVHLTGSSADVDMQALLGASARGIAPERSLVRMDDDDARAVIPALMRGLRRLGYDARQADDVVLYVCGHGSLFDAPHVNHAALKGAGMTDDMIADAESVARTARHLSHVLPEAVIAKLKLTVDEMDDASLHVCGAMTVEGATHVLPQHLAVFDTLSAAGVRRVTPDAQAVMQAAVEPFLDGTAGHVIETGVYATTDDMRALVIRAWEAGVTSLSLYRPGSSLLAPVHIAGVVAGESVQKAPRRRKAS
jgi:ribonucleoside-diphosphate reductase alpha chain